MKMLSHTCRLVRKVFQFVVITLPTLLKVPLQENVCLLRRSMLGVLKKLLNNKIFGT